MKAKREQQMTGVQVQATKFSANDASLKRPPKAIKMRHNEDGHG
jgi:hypothetical protein